MTIKWPVRLAIFGLLSSAWPVLLGGDAIDYGRIKGDALKEVLKPVPPKEPAEALRCLEVIGSQYILNNLQWGLDHKIYAAVAGNGGLVGRADRPEQKPVAGLPVRSGDERF